MPHGMEQLVYNIVTVVCELVCARRVLTLLRCYEVKASAAVLFISVYLHFHLGSCAWASVEPAKLRPCDIVYNVVYINYVNQVGRLEWYGFGTLNELGRY